MKIDNGHEWTEAFLDKSGCAHFFYKSAGVLKAVFKITYTNRLNDLNSIYWDFYHKGAEVVLPFNIFVGTLMFPISLKNATNVDNQIVTEFSKHLMTTLLKFNMPDNFVSQYFYSPPFQWGLRDDPYLWEDLKKATETKNVPMTASEMEKLLHKLFKELTGKEAKKGEDICLKI